MSSSWTGACFKDQLCLICLTSAQISSFSVSPNYELLFFSSELFEVVNILDFFENQPVDIKGELNRFRVNGGPIISERRWEKKRFGSYCGLTCVYTNSGAHRDGPEPGLQDHFGADVSDKATSGRKDLWAASSRHPRLYRWWVWLCLMSVKENECRNYFSDFMFAW